MTRYPSRFLQPAITLLWIALLCLAGFMAQTVFSGSIPGVANEGQPTIECLLPDGQIGAISPSQTSDPISAASIVNGTTLSCPLRPGETTFVIALPIAGERDRLTFVNENLTASGELTIAVSDSRLAANSPKWTEIDGIIPFTHKRLFNVSLVGIETRFVRLTFRIEDGANVGKVSVPGFQTPALASALNSHFAKIHAQHGIDSGLLDSVAQRSDRSLPNE